MPLNLDSCIAGVFTPGNIGASSGLPPVAPIVPSLSGPVPALVELASASETLDAFFGELLHEPASTSDSYTATGGAYEVLLSEPASAVDAANLAQVFNEAVGEVAQATDAPLVYEPGAVNAAVTETGAAADAPDATVVAGVSYATWDSATVTAVTLSGGNLVATNTGTTAANQGAHVASTAGKTSGKYYFEVTWTTLVVTGGNNFGAGIGTTASTFTAMGGGGTTGVEHYRGGTTWSMGSQVLAGIGAWSAGQTTAFAVDLDNRRFWVRYSSGNWNNNASYDPATNIGGLVIPAGTMVPFVTFGGSGGTTGNVLTANFGASAFAFTVPSGFTSGWPA